MKKVLSSLLAAVLLLQHLSMFGYAISHNGDSELEKVTILVFPSEENFEKLLKNQGVTAEQLSKIADNSRKLVAEGSLVSSLMSNDPDALAAVRAITTGVAAATRYSAKPLDWLKAQKLTLAIHKNIERNNQGEGSKWHWKKIKENYGIDKDNPNGLFVVFINPQTKELLFATPLRPVDRIGFSVVRDPETGEFIGKLGSFEKDTETLAKVHKNVFSRFYDYVRGSQTLSDTVNILKKKFISFAQQPGSGEKIVKFLSGEMSNQMSKLGTEIKKMDSATALSQVKPIFNFFREEIEKTKESVKGDPAAEQLLDNTINKFNFFKDAIEEVIVNPIETYREVTAPLTEERIESELGEFHPLGEDIEPATTEATESMDEEPANATPAKINPIPAPIARTTPPAPLAPPAPPAPKLAPKATGTTSGVLPLPKPPVQRFSDEEEGTTNDDDWD